MFLKMQISLSQGQEEGDGNPLHLFGIHTSNALQFGGSRGVERSDQGCLTLDGRRVESGFSSGHS